MTVYIEPIKDYDVLHFAGGEVHIKLKTVINCEDTVVIKKKIFNAADIMELLLVNEVVRRSNPKYVELFMPYIPYARQDRATTSNSPRSLKVFADLLNSCKFDAVSVLDPHSMVAENVIDNMVILSHSHSINLFIQEINYTTPILLSPDFGALKKTENYGKDLNIKEIIIAHKTRNPKTGEIEGIQILGDIPRNRNIVVVDDILDYGGTFTKLLKNTDICKNNKVSLFVTHGIFAGGADIIFDAGYENIGCVDCWINDPRIKVFPLV